MFDSLLRTLLNQQLAAIRTRLGDRFIPRYEVALWVSCTTVEYTAFLTAALYDLSFVTSRTLNACFLDDRLRVTAIREA